MLLFYNADAGEFYHCDAMPHINAKYLPLDRHFYYPGNLIPKNTET